MWVFYEARTDMVKRISGYESLFQNMTLEDMGRSTLPRTYQLFALRLMNKINQHDHNVNVV